MSLVIADYLKTEHLQELSAVLRLVIHDYSSVEKPVFVPGLGRVLHLIRLIVSAFEDASHVHVGAVVPSHLNLDFVKAFLRSVVLYLSRTTMIFVYAKDSSFQNTRSVSPITLYQTRIHSSSVSGRSVRHYHESCCCLYLGH